MANSHRQRLISNLKFRLFVAAHPESSKCLAALKAWERVVKRSEWMNFADVRATYGDASQVGKYVVFNVSGNKLRLVTEIKYNLKPRLVYLRHVLTHREYDKGGWKS